MKFLLISQRAKGTPSYSLKDTPGHGRFDVVVRCILAATRKVTSHSSVNESEIFAFLKGLEPYGWLYLRGPLDLGDESSAASILKEYWSEYWTEGSLSEVVGKFQSDSIFVELSEDGSPISSFLDFCDPADIPKMVLLLGSQCDITEEDRQILRAAIPVVHRVSLGSRSLLASQAITLFRLKLHQWG